MAFTKDTAENGTLPSRHFSLLVVPFFVLFSLWSCAPLEQQRQGSLSRDLPDTAGFQGGREESPPEKPVDDGTPPEPEQAVNQELAKLETLGSWEEGRAPDAQEREQEQETTYDFPVTMNRYVEFYLNYFQKEQRQDFARWLARSGRYLPMIKQMLREAGLPEDLAYLPLIESGYSLTAYSRARAVGPWQFIRSTARNYGLVVNSYIDERRDPIKSTRAAIAYLTDLYGEFGSWPLAVAGYNAGEGKIRRAIKRYKTDNFWEIAQKRYLRLETKRYVPKLIAAIIIAKDPEKYGFIDIAYQEPLQYETVPVPRWTSLRAVALACGADFEELRNLNRELRRTITPPGSSLYTLKVPVGKKELVAKNLPRVRAVATRRYKDHVVKAGETLTRICRRYNLNKTTLLKANNLRMEQLTIGQHLRIPYQTTAYKLMRASADGFGPARPSPDNLVLHTVQPGESVWELSQRYGVPSHMIAAWNGLKDLSRIRAGQQLALYLQKEPEPAAAKYKMASLQEAGSAGKASTALKKETYYDVQGGDTLWSIAQKFQITPEKIRDWNKLDGDVIYPGNRLLLKVAADLGS